MKLLLSENPHIHSGASTSRIMADVLLALAPVTVAACVLFSLRVLLVVFVTVFASVAAEALFCLAVRKKTTVFDLSACVTGVILALNLPYTIPLWQAAVGGVVATAFVKMLFGGLGQNFANPAATSRVILLISFPEVAASTVTRFMTVTDGVSSPTPLAFLNAGTTAGMPDLLSLFLGNHGGAMGETCAVAILVGAAYLFYRRVITPEAPVAFVSGVFLFSLIYSGDFLFALSSVLTGGVLFAAVFMVTDYATVPLTHTGRALFGLGCAVITCVIRYFCALPEGVSYAILCMNILTPFLEKLTYPRAFGGKKA